MFRATLNMHCEPLVQGDNLERMGAIYECLRDYYYLTEWLARPSSILIVSPSKRCALFD